LTNLHQGILRFIRNVQGPRNGNHTPVIHIPLRFCHRKWIEISYTGIDGIYLITPGHLRATQIHNLYVGNVFFAAEVLGILEYLAYFTMAGLICFELNHFTAFLGWYSTQGSGDPRRMFIAEQDLPESATGLSGGGQRDPQSNLRIGSSVASPRQRLDRTFLARSLAYVL
jgi:hypothetical protein